MEVIRRTRSVCPVCLKNISADLTEDGGSVYMEKTCPEHGNFRCIVWRGRTDFRRWRAGAETLGPGDGESCPENCGICAEHLRGTCCALLEVTRCCDLKCRFCFANDAMPEPGMEELKAAVDGIFESGKPTVQLSGGEPAMRDDLPELVGYIKSKGVRYVQLNSNGLRLAKDPGYVKALADAGLSYVFMQFDGTDDGVFGTLRGRPLLDIKRAAIDACGANGIGVTLVPTVVRGVNDGQIGGIIDLARSLSPAVRGVHFQPVSYFGRYPEIPGDDDRYTLDELIAALTEQAGIALENILPSRCDHPACGLHAGFYVDEDGSLVPLTRRDDADTDRETTAEQNRDYIGSRWSRGEPGTVEGTPARGSFDWFLKRAREYSFTVSAMAFQDAMNLDMERMRRCSLHVWSEGRLKPFCAAYLTGMCV